ncbi:MAG: hypothetical protein D3925_04705 [Candidatus Electrothrix sp. AR5]|nr:hypothetical protein [Candidatus Electrothrix sp. AR5]
MDMQRAFLAIIISFVILIGYQKYFVPPVLPVAPGQVEQMGGATTGTSVQQNGGGAGPAFPKTSAQAGHVGLAGQVGQSSVMQPQAIQPVAVDTYLVGPDKLWRSEAWDVQKYKVKSTFLNPRTKVDTEAVKQALAGKSDTQVIVNSLGEKALTTWAPVRYKGLNWALISEVAQEEVDRPVMQLLRIVGLLALLAAVAIVFVSLRVAGGVTKQVDEIMQGIAKVEKGEYGEQVKVTSEESICCKLVVNIRNSKRFTIQYCHVEK